MTTETQTQTQTLSLAELQRQKAQADAEAAKVGAKVADALARRDEAEAQIQAIHRARVTAWAQGVVDGDRQARQDARAAIRDARQAFVTAVSAGDPMFLARYIDLANRHAAYYVLNTRLQNARFELGIVGEPAPELGRDGQTPTLAEALQSVMTSIVGNIVSDHEDAVLDEHAAMVRGDEEEAQP